jgi:hypothetical protein
VEALSKIRHGAEKGFTGCTGAKASAYQAKFFQQLQLARAGLKLDLNKYTVA